MEKLTLVLGASPNPGKFSGRALKLLKQSEIPLIAIGKKEDKSGNIQISRNIPENIGTIHTITLYLNAKNQKEYYDSILFINPRRIIFNPGTLNPELSALARKNGIEIVEDCLIDMLNTGKF